MKHSDSIPGFEDGHARSGATTARYVKDGTDAPYLHAVVGTLGDAWLSGEDGPFDVSIERVGDDIYIVRIAADPSSPVLVDARAGVAIDPELALLDGFPGRVVESDRYQLQWEGDVAPTPEFDASVAAPVAVARAIDIAPGKVRVTRR